MFKKKEDHMNLKMCCALSATKVSAQLCVKGIHKITRRSLIWVFTSYERNNKVIEENGIPDVSFFFGLQYCYNYLHCWYISPTKKCEINGNPPIILTFLD